MGLSQTELAKLYLFAWILGAVLGWFRDMLCLPRTFARQIRSVKKKQTASSLRKKHAFFAGVVFLEDFLFCIVASISLILLFYEQNNGKIRPFAFFAAFVGFSVYRATIGKPIRRLTEKLSGLVVRMVKGFLYAILKPLRYVAHAMRCAIGKRLATLKKQIEKRNRKRYTEKMFDRIETTAAGLLPDNCVLSVKEKEIGAYEERKDKRKKYHGRKEKDTTNHRAKQESTT